MFALAIAGQVDFIVTGHNDLLVLNTFEQIPIIEPAEALRRIEAQK